MDFTTEFIFILFLPLTQIKNPYGRLFNEIFNCLTNKNHPRGISFETFIN